MALNFAQLTDAFASIFSEQPAQSVLVAQKLASAYTTYASAGLFGASAPVLLPSNTLALQVLLAQAIAVPQVGNPALFGAAWAQGLLAFWATPPPPVVGAQVGIVTVIVGAAVVAVPITSACANLAATPRVTATLIATAVHAATLTVTATVAPPPGTILTLL